jgi:hypothetical protein
MLKSSSIQFALVPKGGCGARPFQLAGHKRSAGEEAYTSGPLEARSEGFAATSFRNMPGNLFSSGGYGFGRAATSKINATLADKTILDPRPGPADV